ncbi:hypothetical protein INT45_000794 [Circinella minor]|uniref:Uncharacterized protein n=1 Tax=Circinella minor TaxID=1195481 RepID=A0A8H7RTS4_9FUNG|nr:hypothetical protein INT45_000794 [Circinella minor]
MQHNKRVRTPSPSMNNITEDYHQNKRPRTLDDSHLNEEVNAAMTLTELFDSPAPINRHMHQDKCIRTSDETVEERTVNEDTDMDASPKKKEEIAKEKELKYSTFRYQQKHYQKTFSLRTKKRGPPVKKLMLTDEMYQLLLRYIDNRSVATHSEIHTAFMQKFKHEDVSQERLKKYMHENFRITIERFKTFPEQPKEEDPYFLEISETAYDMNLRRTFVDAKQKEIQKVKAEAKGKKYKPRNKDESDELVPVPTCLVAASPDGILKHTITFLKGPTDERNIRLFLKNLTSLMDISDQFDNG